MTSYKNPFHSNKYQGSVPVIITDANPIEYKDYLIYHRLKSKTHDANIFDIVKDNICLGMCAGLNGAKISIDQLINNEENITRNKLQLLFPKLHKYKELETQAKRR
jgi:hypothetical protein